MSGMTITLDENEIFPIENFEDLYSEYYDCLKNYVSRLLCYGSAAEEIVQEVFIKLYNNKKKITSQNIKGWLYTVAHNDTVNYLRKNSKTIVELKEEFMGSDNPIDKKIEKKFNRMIISQVLVKMPKKQVTAILLKDMDRHSYSEIATIMNISYEAVKSLIYRGRQNFIKYYEELSVSEM